MSEIVMQHLEAFSDDELRDILKRDYRRRLVRYKKTDELMRNKYGMTHDEFVSRNLVAERGHTWAVESDAQDWELAIDGIRTMERRLRELNGEPAQ